MFDRDIKTATEKEKLLSYHDKTLDNILLSILSILSIYYLYYLYYYIRIFNIYAKFFNYLMIKYLFKTRPINFKLNIDII